MKLWSAIMLVLALVTPVSDNQHTAQIRRTEYGIPHVTAKTYGGLGYGYGYAFAQDNLCVMASWVRTLRGERSRYFGAEAMSDDSIKPVPNLASDLYYKGIRDSGVVRRQLALPPPLGPTPRLRELVDGYVAGYNRYLADTGVGRLPDPTCRGKEWVGDITAEDVWSNLLDLDRTAGTAQFKEAITGTGSPAGERRPPGSNGWALGRDSTRDGTTMLLANPHYPWTGSRRFYQVQLTIPGVLDVSGASLYGTPIVLIGHTASVAWTHTVSNAPRFTLYLLKLVPGDPTRYLVDGRPEPMGRQDVTVTVQNGESVTRTLYTSRYGPVIKVDGKALAIADVNATNLRSADEWLAMGTTGNLTQLRAAQNTYQGLPWVYTLATDTGGSVYFSDASVVPHVTDALAERCSAGEEAVLDGSRSSCLWGTDPDAIVPGIFGPANLPTLTRTDYVTNSNESPWLTNPKAPLTYPRIFGDTGTERSLRPRLSHDMISRTGFTLESLQSTALAKRNLSAELLRPGLVKLCRANPVMTATDGKRVDVRQACRTLAAWNGRADGEGRGAVLWREFFTSLNGPHPKAQDPGVSYWKTPFDPARPLSTPRGLDGGDPVVRLALADTVQFFTTNRIRLDLTAAEAQHSVPGCSGGEGCFDRVRTPGPLGADGTYPAVDSGTSFLMAVELTKAGPRSRTLLTYSQSANPASPHHSDQAGLFARSQWVTERFTDAEINADPLLTTITVGGRPGR